MSKAKILKMFLTTIPILCCFHLLSLSLSDKKDFREIEQNNNESGINFYTFSEKKKTTSPILKRQGFLPYEEDKEVIYEFKQYGQTGLFDINVSVKDNLTGESTLVDETVGFGYRSENGKEDFCIEYQGELYNLSTNSKPELTDVSFCETNEGDASSNQNLDFSLRPEEYLPNIVTFGKTILKSQGDAIGLFTTTFISSIPEIDYFNLMPYFMFKVKLALAIFHYNSNYGIISQLDSDEKEQIFGSFIENQQEEDIFKNMYWGLCSATIAETGCEIISVYNALKEANASIDFPSLIMLFELCNADLLGGFLGTTPIDKDYLTTMIVDFLNLSPIVPIFKTIEDVLNALQDFIDDVLCHPITIILTGGVSIVVDKTVVQPFFDSLRIIIFDVFGLAGVFAEHLLSNTASIGDMIKIIFGKNSITEFLPTEWSYFVSTLSKRRRCIVSFTNRWNKYTYSPDLTSQVHTIYITKTYVNHTYLYRAHNNSKTEDYYFTKDQLIAFFGYDLTTKDINGHPCQFLWGGVFND